MLTKANFIALFSALSLAIGIEEIASKPTMMENQITNSLLLGYLNHSAIGTEKKEQAVIKIIVDVKRE